MTTTPFAYGLHDRCVFRPVRREGDSPFDAAECDDDPEYNDYIRVECVDCGFASQGHGQAVSEMFHRYPCDDHVSDEKDDIDPPCVECGKRVGHYMAGRSEWICPFCAGYFDEGKA
jgi:hypothetical protein